MAKFTVDTHLFRELGELLVGRDSTALIELIKNAYDADATEVTVYGENLDKPRRGQILVTDDGIGMTKSQFERGFLRVASRLKEENERRSSLFFRRYTGAKGIGRLAAHKLACKLKIESVPEFEDEESGERESLEATIDWNKIEKYETLDEANEADEIVIDTYKVRKNAKAGTSLTLTNLRRAWTKDERARFLAEVQSFDPPNFLHSKLPKSLIEKAVIFEEAIVREQSEEQEEVDEGFSVKLEGDFAGGEEYWQLVDENASWVVEIRADENDEEVKIGIAPTKRKRKENPAARRLQASIPHPDPVNGPFFDARIMVREGAFRGKRDQRVWASKASGIRVYLEGFRVLPYGEAKNDWLSIDYDYTRRPRQLELLQDLELDFEEEDEDEGLSRLPNNNYFGAVFLTLERAPTMKILVNREGFVDGAGYDNLVDMLRTGVDLCTRARNASEYERRVAKREERGSTGGGGRGQMLLKTSGGRHSGLPKQLDEAAELIRRAREHIVEGDLPAAKIATTAAVNKLADDVISERALLRVLASVGTQMAAFVHEINALLGAAQTVETALHALLEEPGFSRPQRQKLRRSIDAAVELKYGLERQASYLMDVITPDVRRRRSRQRLQERFKAAVSLVDHQAERRRIGIWEEIDKDLKSPPMFSAELTTVFANLLTNAVKAVGVDGDIIAQGFDRKDYVAVRIQNTGVAVDLEDAERWFKPFESTTTEINEVLGQGMGLGLTITRNVLESYGASVEFVKPSKGYSTAIEIRFPK